jgi:parallel beta-helix repeat protein
VRVFFVIHVVVAAVLLGLPCGAATIYVNGTIGDDAWDGACETWADGTCGPKVTIQAGIDIALDGDTIRVADGVYAGLGNRDLDFRGRLVTVRSASGDPTLCVIEGGNGGRGFYFWNWETSDAVVQGFTIRNCVAMTASPEGWRYGGGIYCGQFAAPTIADCLLENNTAAEGGGGIYCGMSSAATITNCSIQGCTGLFGSGVLCDQSSPVFTKCGISDNINPLYDWGWGGGVACVQGASPRFTDCTISGNAAHQGGGVYIVGGGARFTNCLIIGNRYIALDANGGGVYCNGTPRFVNCTFSGNVSGFYCVGPVPTITNCIFWGNPPGEVLGTPPTLSYCDVQGGYAGAGNINADPLFADAAHGNYRLGIGSPCVDVGRNTPPGGLPATDFDGRPRVLDGNGDQIATVDMGAYEFGPQLRGDLNCDNTVDFADISAFVLYLSDLSAWQAVIGGCPAENGDINGDGTYPSFRDINPFVALLGGAVH